MDRRKFVKHAGIAGLAGTAGLLAACGKQDGTASCPEGTAAGSAETFEWKMVTTWPRDFPGLGTGANYLARIIGEMSGGRLTVKVFGGNELVPPFEVFSAAPPRWVMVAPTIGRARFRLRRFSPPCRSA
jgi:TRAP-type mannitol/chloroaromatic compound transport system substrate-binding protein